MLKWLTIRVQRLQWPISRKLWFSFGLILTLFSLNSVVILTGQIEVASLDSQQYRKTQVVENLQILRRTLKAQNDLYADAIFVTGQTTVNDNFGGQVSDILRQLRTDNARLSPAGINALESVTGNYREIVTNLGRLRELLSLGSQQATQQEWPFFAGLFRSTFDNLEQFYAVELQAQLRLGDQKTSLQQLSLFGAFISSVVCLLLSILMALLFSRSIGRPIEQMQIYLDRVAQGNLSSQVEVINRDELGRLAYVLNLALTNLRQVIEGVRISESLQALVQDLSSSSSQQSAGSTEQLSSVREIISTMQQLTHRSEQISSSALSVANASEDTALRTTSLKAVAEHADQIAGQVGQVVNHTINSVAQVNDTVVVLTERLVELTHKAKQISQVVDIISNVANEVHLLALNASIEAAAAGEYGHRFRVVAGEVRNLATRTKDSAGQVTHLVGLVQEAVQQARLEAQATDQRTRDVMQANRQLEFVAASMSGIVQQTVTVATEIFEAARQMDTQAEAIKTATHEQLYSSVQVNNALLVIGKMAQENVDASERIASSTNNLDNISAQLVKTLAGISLS